MANPMEINNRLVPSGINTALIVLKNSGRGMPVTLRRPPIIKLDRATKINGSRERLFNRFLRVAKEMGRFRRLLRTSCCMVYPIASAENIENIMKKEISNFVICLHLRSDGV
jgi:hypothetical protein